VIPQALCSRHGLAIGAHLAWFVTVLMVILLPVAWPLSKLLDLLLGCSAACFLSGEHVHFVNPRV
jgi:CBS domain containing-hemolysin-like protein